MWVGSGIRALRVVEVAAASVRQSARRVNPAASVVRDATRLSHHPGRGVPATLLSTAGSHQRTGGQCAHDTSTQPGQRGAQGTHR